ncbi:MAG: radical SAM protein [Candidatus Hydrothermarchaeaceae archaeon]
MDEEVPVPTELISQIHVLDQCNLKCTHCYVGDNRFKPRKMPDLKTLKKRIKTISDFSKKMGFKDHTMNISGGEPTLRGDLLDIIRYITENDAVPMLLTNGMLLDLDFAKKIRDAGCCHVQISIEGLEKYNNSIRGADTFKKALKAVENANAADLKVVIGTTLSEGNIGNMRDFFKKLDGKVDKFHVREVTGIGDGKNLKLMTPKERKDFYEYAHSWNGKTRLFIEDPPYCSVSDDLVDKRAGCGAFICLLCVDVDGSVYPCRKAPVRMGHVDDLDSAWNSPVALKLRNRDFEGKCGSCEIKWSCGGCRGYAASRGNLLGSDYRCLRRG